MGPSALSLSQPYCLWGPGAAPSPGAAVPSEDLLLPQVAINDLSPAGPIQAVEIFMESPSLADMCRMHHAVIRRIQVPPVPPSSPQTQPRGPQAKPMPWGQTLGAQLGAWGRFLRHHRVADEPGVTPG